MVPSCFYSLVFSQKIRFFFLIFSQLRCLIGTREKHTVDKDLFSNARWEKLENCLFDRRREKEKRSRKIEKGGDCKKNYKNSAKKLRRYSSCFAFFFSFSGVVIQLIFSFYFVCWYSSFNRLDCLIHQHLHLLRAGRQTCCGFQIPTHGQTRRHQRR